jgi:hypothetical protein
LEIIQIILDIAFFAPEETEEEQADGTKAG